VPWAELPGAEIRHPSSRMAIANPAELGRIARASSCSIIIYTILEVINRDFKFHEELPELAHQPCILPESSWRNGSSLPTTLVSLT